jgi:predicted metalloprotease with PDZ domain
VGIGSLIYHLPEYKIPAGARMNPRLLLPVLALCLALPAAHAQSNSPITLTVDSTHSPQRILHARESIPVHAGPLTLYYPKWIPGDHSPDGPLEGLSGLHFTADGKEIPWQRDLVEMFAFHVDIPAGVTHLDAAYDFIEGEGVSASDKLLVLEWNEVALYPAGPPTSQITYNAILTRPEGWGFGTSLPIDHESGSTVTFKPITFDLLVDSPVIEGQYYRTVDLTPPGEPIHHELDLAADSEAALAIPAAIQKGLVNVVAESGVLFGARHYRDYHFLLALSDHVAHFGLEHHESNDSRLPERVFLSPGGAFTVGGLLPHEFVHSWNGKYRRPADLTTPDFEKPMETDLLWGYEGLTDYLGPMLAARSGLWTPEQYREYLASISASLGPGRPGRTWRPLVDTAAGEPAGGPGGGVRGWMNWRRGVDYYDEGDLVWLEAATIIHNVTHGQKSIDDFCHAFHGSANNGPEVKTYTFDQLVATLNFVAPYDWASFLNQRLDSKSPDAPNGGIENGGWKVTFSDQPIHLPGRRGGSGDAYSIGLQLNEEGMVADSIVGSPAYTAGITSGMKVIGVNGRVYTHDLLQDAIDAAKNGSAPITLTYVADDFIHTAAIDYHGGPRYPHLTRDDSKPDYLDELITAHVSTK